MMTFDEWWHNYGSGITCGVYQDAHEHARVVAQAAWTLINGSSSSTSKPGSIGRRLSSELGWRTVEPKDGMIRKSLGFCWGNSKLNYL